MPNFGDLIGAFMQNAAAPSGQGRMGNVLQDLQQGFGGGGGFGGAGGGGDLLGGILDMAKGGLSSAAQNPAAAGGIGAVLGSLIGGGGDSVKGALGGGALAMLAGVAIKALMNSGQSGGAMPLGLQAAQTPDEQQAQEQTAALIIKGMINAAKSDGSIGPQEMQRIVGKLKESGMDDEAQQWVMMEMSRPLDLNAFVAEIPDRQTAAQVYAASLLAIEVDTQEERAYLRQLAQSTGLDAAVVAQIHQTMGVAV